MRFCLSIKCVCVCLHASLRLYAFCVSPRWWWLAAPVTVRSPSPAPSGPAWGAGPRPQDTAPPSPADWGNQGETTLRHRLSSTQPQLTSSDCFNNTLLQLEGGVAEEDCISDPPLYSSHQLLLPLALGLNQVLFRLQHGAALLQTLLQTSHCVLQTLGLPLTLLQLMDTYRNRKLGLYTHCLWLSQPHLREHHRNIYVQRPLTKTDLAKGISVHTTHKPLNKVDTVWFLLTSGGKMVYYMITIRQQWDSIWRWFNYHYSKDRQGKHNRRHIILRLTGGC